MRSSFASLLVALCALPLAAQELGGHRVSLQLRAGHVALHEDIRFEGDTLFEVGIAYELVEWLELCVALSQMRAWDRRQEHWSNSVGFALHADVWPSTLTRSGLGALSGMSLMGFDDDESDLVVEGLDLGLAWRRTLGGSWQLRAEAFGRLQSYEFIRVDSLGVPVGGTEETGFLWSRVLRAGVSLAF
jgi:hypothetical protein